MWAASTTHYRDKKTGKYVRESCDNEEFEWIGKDVRLRYVYNHKHSTYYGNVKTKDTSTGLYNTSKDEVVEKFIISNIIGCAETLSHLEQKKMDDKLKNQRIKKEKIEKETNKL
jgi:hypothetical protein